MCRELPLYKKKQWGEIKKTFATFLTRIYYQLNYFLHKIVKKTQKLTERPFNFQAAVAERKQYMKEQDIERVQNEKLSELEEEEREKREYLKEKANAQRQEQEDEIKKLNEVRTHIFSTYNL